MILAVGTLFFWFLIVFAAVCIVVAVIAVCDSLRGGTEQFAEFEQWLRARDVTGRGARSEPSLRDRP